MKVLSLKEPYATLILTNKKLIETRSWKTNYRGELYIHASITKVPKTTNNEIKKLIGNTTFNYGHIICKCILVDCIYMTEDFILNIKKNNYQEYMCGEYKVGRYAWYLKDIKQLKKPIPAKGNLNIWNYYQEFEIMELMKEIEYGWIDKNGLKHIIVDETFADNFIFQSPHEVLKNKIGICWEQVELERYYFKNSPYSFKTFFIVHYDNAKCPTHTFLTYTKSNKFYWFEHSWEKFRGFHEYKSLKELLNDIQDKFIKYELNNKYLKSNLKIYEYSEPEAHISCLGFYHHCESGTEINI